MNIDRVIFLFLVIMVPVALWATTQDFLIRTEIGAFVFLITFLYDTIKQDDFQKEKIDFRQKAYDFYIDKLEEAYENPDTTEKSLIRLQKSAFELIKEDWLSMGITGSNVIRDANFKVSLWERNDNDSSKSYEKS